MGPEAPLVVMIEMEPYFFLGLSLGVFLTLPLSLPFDLSAIGRSFLQLFCLSQGRSPPRRTVLSA
jgi:hypothetical protein